jgi:hypothetical protein
MFESQGTASRPAMHMHTPLATIARASLALVPLLAFGGCKAVQPKPQCKAQPADYAAKYTVVSKSDPMCAEMSGELLHLQYYRATPGDAKGVPSMAIEPSSIADAIAPAQAFNDALDPDDPMSDMKKIPIKVDREYSLAKFATVEPGDDDTCVASKFDEVSALTSVGAVPEDKEACPPADAVEAIDKPITYKWSNLKMIVTPTSNGVYFGATLVRTDGPCSVTYKVTAVNPAVGCGDATSIPQEVDKMTMMCGDKKDPDTGKVVDAEADPFSGKPVQSACDATIQGAGLNPELTYKCDASEDGMTGTHLCLPEQDFPALAKKN